MQKFFLLLAAIFVFIFTGAGQVGIGTNTPHSSAALDITSTNKGFLIPRLSTYRRTAGIISPADGLIVYDTDTKSFWFYKVSQGWIEINDASQNAAHKAGFNAILSINQTVPNYALTTLAPYIILYDYNHNFDAATGTFTARENGLYHFTVSVEIVTPASNELCIIQCLVNGSVVTAGTKTTIIPTVGAPFYISVCFPFDIELNAGDKFTYQFLQRTGLAQTIYGGNAAETTVFSGYKVF